MLERKENTLATLWLFLLMITLFSSPASGITINPTKESIKDNTANQQDVEELFKKAMKDRKEGRYQSSIASFHKILSADPSLHRARLELAVVYYRILRYEEAITEAKKVAAAPDVPPNIKIAVLAFIAQSEKESQQVEGKAEWHFPVSIGCLTDDNVNIGPSSSLLPSGLVLTPDSLPKSDDAIELGIGINHTYQTGKILHFGSTPAALYILSGANIFNRNYFNEDTDITVISLRTGPALIGQKKWRTLLSLQWDRLLYANVPLADFYTATSNFTWYLPHAIEATAELALGKRLYIGNDYTTRDNDYFAPRIILGCAPLGKKLSLQFSGQYFRENADAARYSNEGRELFGSATWNFKKKTSLYISYNRRDSRYDGLEPTFTERRNETKHRYTIGLSHKLTAQNSVLNAWAIDAKATITRNSSNVMTTDYERNQYSLTMSKTF